MMKVIRMIVRYSGKRLLIRAVVFAAISGAGSIGLIAILNKALNLFNPAADPLLLWGFVGLSLAMTLTRIASSVILAELGAGAACRLQVGLCQRILAAPLRRLESLGAHRLLVALTDDVVSVSSLLRTIPIAVVNGAVVAACMVYMTMLSWRMLLIIVVFIVLGVIAYRLALAAGHRRQQLARETEDQLFKHFRGATQGTKELKMLGRRRRAFLSNVQSTAEEYKGFLVAAQKIYIAAASWGTLLFFVVLGIVIFIGPVFFQVSKQTLSGYTLVLLYMLGPLQMILNLAPLATQAKVALDKIDRLGISLHDEAEPFDIEPKEVSLPPWQRLEMVGLEHTYHHFDESSNFTLGPMDLSLKRGEIVFVVGGNGCGKTTLAKLLIGLYVPEGGEIHFDDRQVNDENLLDYRKLFSVVFSDFFLFESLLGLGSSDLDAKAKEYLEMLQLKRKVRVQGGELSTVDLSQGQRKRLALLTACLEDRPIFVFDEWAADQDPEFKKVFYHQILPELKAQGKTVVAISHDDAYYHVADRVIKMDYGQIVYDSPIGETPYGSRSAGTETAADVVLEPTVT